MTFFILNIFIEWRKHIFDDRLQLCFCNTFIFVNRLIRGVKIITQARRPKLFHAKLLSACEYVRGRARASLCVCVLRLRAQIARLLFWRPARGINNFFLLNGKYSSNGRVPETSTQTQSIFLAFLAFILTMAVLVIRLSEEMTLQKFWLLLIHLHCWGSPRRTLEDSIKRLGITEFHVNFVNED